MHKTLSEETYTHYIKTLCPKYDEFNEIIVNKVAGLTSKKGITLVDLGIGIGNLESRLYEKGLGENVSVYGIDENKEVLEYVKTRLWNKMMLHLEQGVIPEVYLPKAEIYVSAMTLHHIPRVEQKERVFKKITRQLEDNGKFLHLEMFTGRDDKEKEQYFEKIRDNLEPQYPFVRWMEASKEVDHFWTFAEEENLLERLGGKVKVLAKDTPFILYEFTRT